MTPARRIVSLAGVLHPAESAKVSVFDRGFLYGDAVFEVLRTYGGRPFALGEHLARLRRSAERVFIALPVSEAVLANELEEALRAAGNDESYVRIMVTRGSGPVSLDPGSARDPLRVIIVEPLVPPSREVYARGIAAVSVRTRRAVDDTAAAGAKVTNYLSNLLAVREARARSADEALVVDEGGTVVEGASSNVFVVVDGGVVTPPASAGILVGITRTHVIAGAAALGLSVEERAISLDELCASSEVFVTSSIREVMPVVRVDERTIGTGAPGPLTRAIHRRFRDDVGMGGEPMPYDP